MLNRFDVLAKSTSGRRGSAAPLFWVAMNLAVVVFLWAGQSSAATNSGITYQGRILKPDATSLSGVHTQFKLQIRAPDSNNCLMYEELQEQNLSASNGMFSVTLNDGTGTRIDSSGYGLDRIFANRGVFNFAGSACSSGTDYTPGSGDGRAMVVQFKDETMGAWEQIPAQKINFIPLAFEAKQVQGFTASGLLRVLDGAGDPSTTVAALTPANYGELVALLAGTSTQYTGSNRLGGAALPSMTTGQVLGWNGTTWVSTDPAPAVGSVGSAQIAAGAVGTTQVSNTVSISTSGTVAAAVTTTRDFKIFPTTPTSNTNSISFEAPSALATPYTLMFPLDAGTSGQVLTTNGVGNLSWTSAATQWLVNGTSLGYTAGNVGIGTTAPGRTLEVGNLSAASDRLVRVSTAGSYSSGFELVSDDTGGSYNGWQIAQNGNIGNGALRLSRFSSGTLGQPVMSLDWVTGNIGIGTTTPLVPLHVVKDNGVGSVVVLQSNSSAKGLLLGTTNGTGYGFIQGAKADGTNDVLNINPYGGRVGIGTTTSATKLQVAGSLMIGNGAETCSGGNYAGAMRYNTGTSSVEMCNGIGWLVISSGTSSNSANLSTITNTGGSLTLSPQATSSVYVTSTVASTSSATGALVISGGIGAAGAINSALDINATTTMSAGTSLTTPQIYGSSAASSNIKIDGTSGTPRGNVLLATAGGNVGIGTTAPAVALHVDGSQNLNSRLTNADTRPAVAAGTLTYGEVRGLGGALSTADHGFMRLSAGGGTAAASKSFIDISGYSTVPDMNKNIVFGTNGVEKMRLDASGNVGIGTTSPAALLHILGSGATTRIGNTTTDYLNFSDTSAGLAAITKVTSLGSSYLDLSSNPTDGTSGTNIRFFRNTTTSGSRSIQVLKGDGTATINAQIDASGAGNSYLAALGGNVGIGTTAPNSNLQVGTQASVSTATPVSVSLGGTYSSSAGANLKMKVYDDGTNAVGFGFSFGQLDYVTNTGSSHVFYTGTTERLRILNTGNVGIGTTAPVRKLDVSQSADSYASGIGVTSTGGNRLNLWADAAGGRIDGGNGNAILALNGSGTGNVGIGTTAPTQKLEVNGTVLATAYLYSSDERLKKNIVPLDDSLNKILSLRPMRYGWIRPTNKDMEREQIGLLAQDVLQVYPQAVQRDNQGWLRLNYPALVAPIIGATKEIYAYVLGLKLENEQLKAAMAQQQREIDQLKKDKENLEERLGRLEKQMTRLPACSE